MGAVLDPPTFPPLYPTTCQAGTCANEHRNGRINAVAAAFWDCTYYAEQGIVGLASWVIYSIGLCAQHARA
jgi:hypothetical protein